MSDVVRRLEIALLHAYARGCTDLLTLQSLAAGHLGLRREHVTVCLDDTSAGVTIRVLLGRGDTRVSPLATVHDASAARRARACHKCFGLGCEVCAGRGWHPRRHRAA